MTLTLTIDQPAYFDRLAEIEADHWWSFGMWRIATHFLDDSIRGRRGLRALDVGCGTGWTAIRLARRPEIVQVAGLDPSPAALAHARRRHSFPLVQGSALDLPFGDRSFDLVTCFDVLQHLPAGTDVRAAAEFRRVLRPGGFAVVRSNALGPRGNPETCYRLDRLRAILAGHELSVRRATYANCLPGLWQEVHGRIGQWWSANRYRNHPAGGGLRIRLPPPALNRLMKSVAALEAAVAARAGLPFGHSTFLLLERTS